MLFAIKDGGDTYKVNAQNWDMCILVLTLVTDYECRQWFHMPKTWSFHGHFGMESIPDLFNYIIKVLLEPGASIVQSYICCIIMCTGYPLEFFFCNMTFKRAYLLVSYIYQVYVMKDKSTSW